MFIIIAKKYFIAHFNATYVYQGDDDDDVSFSAHVSCFRKLKFDIFGNHGS